MYFLSFHLCNRFNIRRTVGEGDLGFHATKFYIDCNLVISSLIHIKNIVLIFSPLMKVIRSHIFHRKNPCLGSHLVRKV